jgi:hypothetical protein
VYFVLGGFQMDADEKKATPGKEKFEEAHRHFKAAHEAMHKSVGMLLPEGFVEQRKTARKEFLLAMRSMLDAAIEHSETK